VTLQVDPLTGAVTLQERVSREDGASTRSTAVPVTSEHLHVEASCRGCADRILDNQTITVRFTVRQFLLDGVDFQRTAAGDAIGAMSCGNCQIRSAELRGVRPSPLPAQSGPADVFEVVLRVDVIELRPFTVHFDLLTAGIEVSIGATYAQISAGSQHTCAVRTDGSLECWGNNSRGQATPPAGTGYKQVSGGRYHTCAVRTDGSLACWGYDWHGQATPPAGTGFARVSAGGSHTCALRTDGSLACWGRESFGEANPPAVSRPGAVTADRHR
jgi:hypothetical protein